MHPISKVITLIFFLNPFLSLNNLYSLSFSPSTINKDTALNKKRFAIVNTSTLIGLVGSYHFINTAWWADSKKTFHFDGGGSNIKDAFNLGRDAVYAKKLDKFGHRQVFSSLEEDKR